MASLSALVLSSSNPIRDVINAIMLGALYLKVGLAILLVLHFVLLLWVFSDYSNRGGGGCGGCFWAIIVLHFGFLGLICYLIVRPAKRPPPQAAQQMIAPQMMAPQPMAPQSMAPQSMAPQMPRAASPGSAPTHQRQRPPTHQRPIPGPPFQGDPPRVPTAQLPQRSPAPSFAPDPHFAPLPQQPIASPQVRRCPNCSAALEPGDRFCQTCGATTTQPRAAMPQVRTLTIGRDASCSICLDAVQVSARHAQLVISPAGVFIEDLGSSNGTFVRGQAIQERVKLAPGDTIGFGSYEVGYAELMRWVSG